MKYLTLTVNFSHYSLREMPRDFSHFVKLSSELGILHSGITCNAWFHYMPVTYIQHNIQPFEASTAFYFGDSQMHDLE